MNVPQTVMRWYDPIKATLARLKYDNLDPRLVLAVLWQESITGNPWAMRPEHGYPWLWDVKRNQPVRKLSELEALSYEPPGDFRSLAGSAAQEWEGQRKSWGLMQIMGAAAREQGFHGAYLSELCEPYTNLEYGIKHLWRYAFQSGNRSTVDALQRWNGGGNKDYASQVIGKRGDIENALNN